MVICAAVAMADVDGFGVPGDEVDVALGWVVGAEFVSVTGGAVEEGGRVCASVVVVMGREVATNAS